jgi:hypothetical protein
LAAAPGDVLAVWTSPGLVSDLIRVGEALGGLPAVANHVAIVTHQDQKGRVDRYPGLAGRRRPGRLHKLARRQPDPVQP